ncbi:MFS transporter [Saltatorellus ferox]
MLRLLRSAGPPMLFRFSLYGFLKNLRFFDAFLVLALRERGLDFLAIGTLVAIREVTVLVLEVPSGALADALGRKRCMVASMVGYIASGLLLGLSSNVWLLGLAMVAYGFGDAFRSGTHKAMILAWLRQQGRLDERTRIYGYTRSWSQFGSAISALAGGGLLLAGTGYRSMFLASSFVATLNLINLATYPNELDGARPAKGQMIGGTYRQLMATIRSVVRQGSLRTLLISGVAVRSGYKVAKDYLQPVLQALALSVPLALDWEPEQRIGVIVGVVSAALFLLSSYASRQAHRYERHYGDPDRGARALILQHAVAFAVLGAALALGLVWPAIALFIVLAIGQNLWRPVQVGRLGLAGPEDQIATVLSIESQMAAFFAACMAPAVGWLVDLVADGRTPVPLTALAPVALLGLPLLVGLGRMRPPSPGRVTP